MDLAICQHIKMGGGRCGSPAMRGQDFCYFHAGAHRTIPAVDLWPKSKARTSSGELKASSGQVAGRVSDGDRQDALWQRCRLTGEALAVQVGLSRLAQGITQGLLNVRQAKILLAALQRAAVKRRSSSALHPSRINSSRCNIQSLNDYNKRAALIDPPVGDGATHGGPERLCLRTSVSPYPN